MQAYRFETKLTRAAELITDPYEAYVRRRLEERRRAKLELQRLAEEAMMMPAKPMKGNRAIVVVRRGDGKVIFRKTPEKPPTVPKRKVHEEMARLARLASRLTHEEVAELVGGQVVDVGRYTGNPDLAGKKAILIDGKLLTKTQAIMKLLKGKRFSIPESAEERLVKLAKWALGIED